MFTISYSEFAASSIYSDFAVSFMPGISLRETLSSAAKVLLNIDSKVAFVYCD
jgi:hypothetical protein